LIEETHPDLGARDGRDLRYVDTLFTEQERGGSIECSPTTFKLPDIMDKSLLMSIIVTLGHVIFLVKVKAAFRLCDGVAVFFETFTGFTTIYGNHIKSTQDNARRKTEHICYGPLYIELAGSMFNCDPEGPLMVHTIKLYPTQDGTTLHVYGPVMSGMMQAGCDVMILDEFHSDGRRRLEAGVRRLWISEARCPEGSARLIGLYVVRCNSCWKEAAVVPSTSIHYI